jgi:hypothetical protein
VILGDVPIFGRFVDAKIAALAERNFTASWRSIQITQFIPTFEAG